MMAYRWPGNVRELRNAVRLAVNASQAERYDVEDLPDKVQAEQTPVDDLRTRLTEALAAAGGNVSQAARALGMRRAGIYEQLNRLGIDPAQFRRR